MFLEDLGLEKSGLDKLISASYSLLGLISYLTSGADETRAWTITKGTKAPQAAGKNQAYFLLPNKVYTTIQFNILPNTASISMVLFSVRILRIIVIDIYQFLRSPIIIFCIVVILFFLVIILQMA